ncbi:conserved membrane hypothetical protein [Vibrio crassostreae]|uniref:Uncharacterized protein n=1 Tax=Vibrio qingdaonensis TaxID=2829491 RepID=A0A9X3CR86_9VIBR|nr:MULTISPECIES: hypothetical protein [Vibrio]NOH77370.1 hypothetical protein [Vibrio crassostreae]MCW8348182.1 hypothetical protein [Vibrio qingdaonensis]MDN3633009.1 hypothetical protein [Vibrio lentus]CAK2481807.1 conserved membrane hypothetical protein [Vibrio crassostreae]CAK2800998.1 conserved membrane hypothetical protein [Vibrio crassostreae]
MLARGLFLSLIYLNIAILFLSVLWLLVPSFKQYSLSDYYAYIAIVILVLSALVSQGGRNSTEVTDNKNNYRAVVFLLTLGLILMIKSFVLTLI